MSDKDRQHNKLIEALQHGHSPWLTLNLPAYSDMDGSRADLDVVVTMPLNYLQTISKLIALKWFSYIDNSPEADFTPKSYEEMPYLSVGITSRTVDKPCFKLDDNKATSDFSVPGELYFLRWSLEKIFVRLELIPGLYSQAKFVDLLNIFLPLPDETRSIRAMIDKHFFELCEKVLNLEDACEETSFFKSGEFISTYEMKIPKGMNGLTLIQNMGLGTIAFSKIENKYYGDLALSVLAYLRASSSPAAFEMYSTGRSLEKIYDTYFQENWKSKSYDHFISEARKYYDTAPDDIRKHIVHLLSPLYDIFKISFFSLPFSETEIAIGMIFKFENSHNESFDSFTIHRDTHMVRDSFGGNEWLEKSFKRTFLRNKSFRDTILK